jgi:hypothetical protein
VPEPDCVVSIKSCYPILTYRVTKVCDNIITLDRETPDYSDLLPIYFARVIVYPPTLTTIYDSITPSNHWSDSVINFESVCYTDQFDVKIWNMNIPWSENPAGLNSANQKDYTQFGSINYLGSKEYFGYASSSGQTTTIPNYYFNSFSDTIIVTPEEQKSIAIIHYTNQTVDLFYGEKFALEPFDNTVDDTTGQARNFKVHIPWLMWHKNTDCCNGQTFYVDPPGFDGLNLFENGLNYIKSTKNPDMNEPGLRYYNLYDDNLSHVKAYLHGLSYISVKTIVTDATNVTSLHEKLVRACLQNWYEEYPIYKKNLYNSYHLYFNFIKELILNEDASFLKNYEPFSKMILIDNYMYFVNLYLKEIKHKKSANKSYLKFLLTEIELTYNHPKYRETNYEKIYNLSQNLIEITSKLLKITCVWSLLYQIQVLTKNTSINNIFIYVNSDIKEFTLFVLETLGFYKVI